MNESSIVLEDIDCPTVRGQIKGLLEDLIQLCPSDSTVRAHVSKIQGRFLGEIRVASQSVYMCAADQAAGLTEVVDHLKAQLLTQILDWRAHRFAS